MSEEEWDKIITVNLKGHFTCTKYACQWFKEQGNGRIINTSSRAFLGGLGQASYSASKAGIIGLTRTIALDVGKYGITCNAIVPSAGTRMTLSPEIAALWERHGKGDMIRQTQEIDPSDNAPFVVFLATDQAASINGCVFRVAGGQVSLYSEPELMRTIYKQGRWSVDELLEIVPHTLSAGLEREKKSFLASL
jgi:NAD(P)-dependent dehydrogenase (short-subunit alcohol dehydrogenase family)